MGADDDTKLLTPRCSLRLAFARRSQLVVAVPENYEFIYDPLLSRPNEVVGLNLRFSLVNALQANEIVTLFLPKFGNQTQSNGNVTMLARHPTTLAQLPIAGAWDQANEKITFTARNDIDNTRAPLGDARYPKGILVEVLVRASNGLTAPPRGVRSGSTGESGIYLTTNTALGPVVTPAGSAYAYPEVLHGVGVAAAAVNKFEPAVAGQASRISLNFTHTSPLDINDEIKFVLPGFAADSGLGALNVTDLNKQPEDFPFGTSQFTVAFTAPVLTLKARQGINASTFHDLQIQGLALPSVGVMPSSPTAISPQSLGDIMLQINSHSEELSKVNTVPGVGKLDAASFTFGSAPELSSAVPIYLSGTIAKGGEKGIKVATPPLHQVSNVRRHNHPLSLSRLRLRRGRSGQGVRERFLDDCVRRRDYRARRLRQRLGLFRVGRLVRVLYDLWADADLHLHLPERFHRRPLQLRAVRPRHCRRDHSRGTHHSLEQVLLRSRVDAVSDHPAPGAHVLSEAAHWIFHKVRAGKENRRATMTSFTHRLFLSSLSLARSGYPLLRYFPTDLGGNRNYQLNITVKTDVDLDSDDYMYFILPHFHGRVFGPSVNNETGTGGTTYQQLAINGASTSVVIVGTNEIVVSADFYQSFASGAQVVYDNGGGGDIGGLTDGNTYYLIKSATANRMKLAASFNDATAGTPVPVGINAVGSGNSHDLQIISFTGTDQYMNTTNGFRMWWRQEESITHGGVTYNCSMPSSHCLKVKITDYIPARTEFTINVPQSMGLRIPALGLPTDSAQHGLKALSMATNGPVMAAKNIQNSLCSGFCDLEINYEAVYTNTDDFKFTITFQLPAVIAAGEALRVKLKGFTGASIAVVSYAITGGTTGGATLGTSSFKIHWDLASTNLILVAQVAIDAGSRVEIDVLKDQIGLPATALTGQCLSDGITMTSNSSLFNENAPTVDLSIDGSSTAVVIAASNEVVVEARLYEALTNGDQIKYSSGGGGGTEIIRALP